MKRVINLVGKGSKRIRIDYLVVSLNFVGIFMYGISLRCSNLDIPNVSNTCISNSFDPAHTSQPKICGFHTSDRTTVIAASKSHSRRKHGGTLIGQCELDSHADTTVAGGNCCVLHYTGRECDVFPYSEDYKPVKGVPIVTAGTAWQSPFTGQTYILVFNEALHMPSLPNSLINPNQLRYYGTWVQDNPVLDSPLHIRTEDASFSMPLEIRGTTIFAVTQTPTEHELNTCPRIILSVPSNSSKAILTFFISAIMASHQRVFLFSMSNCLASAILFGILIPNLWLRCQYFDFTLLMMRSLFSRT